jgi:formate hydrogenlyase subunit 3/multisubunit Na+/H+ antiporter MnhD subunit
LVSGLAAIYGGGYLRAYLGSRRVAVALVFFDLLVASMAMVAIARDGILFLVAWEVMSVASFFLVTYEDERENVRRAGMTYLIASQLSVVFLFVLFALLGGSGTYDFDSFPERNAAAAGLANVCFLLALVGFGTKAGFWPVHIWLPDAHSAAPSQVSAVMSGVMIKMGIYGLLRTLTFLGQPQPWWASVLLAIGAISGLTGILQALAQRDLKRRLAYSSVENIGVIGLGIGLGVLGQSQGKASIAFLGYAGALLHVLNHGLFKSLLFNCAGNVLHATGRRDIDSLGALYRRMPTTGTIFLLASMAICALPPLNGFVSEWLIYLAAFRGSASLSTAWAVWALVPIPALALVGGAAAACFVGAFGNVFLGQSRSEATLEAHEVATSMRLPMIVGAVLCAAIGLWPTGVLQLIAPAAGLMAGIQVPIGNVGPLVAITRVALVLLLLIALLSVFRLGLLRGRAVRTATTWGCGYNALSPRMQYTAISFAEPLLTPFAPLIPARIQEQRLVGYFPAKASYEKQFGDVAWERFLLPGTRRVVRAISRLHVIQQGRVQLYLVYIAVTLVVLLLWQVRGMGR